MTLMLHTGACDAPLLGYRHWTIVGSFHSRSSAESMRAKTISNNPDLHLEIWGPEKRSGGRYWTIMLAACTDARHAHLALALARLRGIADDAFVWYDRPPWVPAN